MAPADVSTVRSRVLLVTRNFPPRLGGMERLIHHALEELARDFDVAFVGPQGSEAFAAAACDSRMCPLSPVPRFLWHCQIKCLQLARRFRPDLILAGSGATVLAAAFAARRVGAAAACYVHGLDLVTRNRAYRSVFVPAIRSCDRVIVNSRNTGLLAERLDVPSQRIRVLNPGVALPTDKGGEDDFRAFAGIDPASSILLSVGRLVPRKGLAEFVERILPRIVAGRPDTVLVVVGGEPDHALLHRAGERRRIERAATAAGLARHVRLLGALDDSRLDQAYAAARLLVFPLREVPGDVEGFGMVAVEAAAHGLPTVAFALGGVCDAIRHGVSGYLITPDDDEAFACAVLTHLEQTDRERWRRSCREFAADFAWPRFGERLRAICREAIAARSGH